MTFLLLVVLLLPRMDRKFHVELIHFEGNGVVAFDPERRIERVDVFRHAHRVGKVEFGRIKFEVPQLRQIRSNHLLPTFSVQIHHVEAQIDLEHFDRLAENVQKILQIGKLQFGTAQRQGSELWKRQVFVLIGDERRLEDAVTGQMPNRR